MPRYQIIDNDKLQECIKILAENHIGNDRSILLKGLEKAKELAIILSPEEAEAKFKEVFDAGAKDCRSDNYNTEWGFDYDDTTSFYNFKKTL